MSAEQNNATIRFVTGVDHRYFDQIFLLLGSLRTYSPTVHLHVCDFGLNEKQREFLRLRGSLLEIPADLPPPRHPWDYKAALGRYVEHWGDDPIMWLDSDLIVMTDLGASMALLNQELTKNDVSMAVCGSSSLREQQEIDPAPHYASLVESYNQDLPYLNSGFFLCRSHAFLKQWHEQCMQMRLEMLYEQNAFNLVAFRQPKIMMLDPEIWNLTSDRLVTMRLEQEGNGRHIVWNGEHRVNIVHLTSNDRARDLFQGYQTFELKGYKIDCEFRLLRREDFRPLLGALIYGGISAERKLLIESGLAVPV